MLAKNLGHFPLGNVDDALEHPLPHARPRGSRFLGSQCNFQIDPVALRGNQHQVRPRNARPSKQSGFLGITDEDTEIMKEYKGSPALDAGLIAAAQAVEHYEISRYGTLRTWAEELGLNDAVSLLQETLDEEKATDEVLTKIAESVVNREAEAA